VAADHPFPPTGYAAVREAAAWAALEGRTAILASGRDAVRFVDKFTTAALAMLSPGDSAEGFFADVRGWVLALATIVRVDDGLWIDCPPGVADRLRTHLEHFHIREDVAFIDASADRAACIVAGPDSTTWLARRSEATLPARLLGNVRTQLGGIDVLVVRVDWCGPHGFLVQSAAADAARLHRWFTAEGLPRADASAVETVRIEERYPHPADMPDKTLPQELDRTARAISFTKGCYLGQETVARIDAVGHVNRSLALIATAGQTPPQPGATVTLAGEPVGVITSACLSPLCGGPAALGILHRRALAAGSDLTVGGVAARIVPRAPAAAAAQQEPS
jgi:folate-binding protein YgfZ